MIVGMGIGIVCDAAHVCMFFAKNMKSEKGENLVVVLGQNGIDVSEDENGGDRVDGGEVDVLDEAGVVTRMHAAKPAQLTL